MTFEIIDNFLPKEDFEKIKNSILNPYFSWNLTPTISNLKEDLKVYCSYYFTHEFWSGFHIKPESQLFVPILNQLDCKSVIRIKGNLYPSTPEIEHHDNHIDYEFPHKGAIFYLNTNNGLTVTGDKEVKSVENRLLLFNPSVPHHSTTCSDDKCRVNINFNFF